MNKVEMSLDDIIKNSKEIRNMRFNRGGARGGAGKDNVRRTSGGYNFKRSPGRRGSGGGRPFRSRGNFRSIPYSKGDIDSEWTHDLYESTGYGGGRGGGGGGTSSAKILISNLDFAVNNSDIKELFSEFGPLKSAKLHYDRSGRSLGTADLVYERRADAIKAVKQYNGVPLDGRPMQIQLAADVSVIENSSRMSGGGGGGYRNGTSSSYTNTYRPRGGGAAASRGFRRGGGSRGGTGGRGGRGGRNSAPKPTQEQLDAELDAMREKMDTS